ncbi:MarR family winged helix-turn-helix transcriptional regulator [Actinoplanes sp. NPDC051494]|uniref:MarR family winged helix-turn-helix transcriptional regulator n=1 Tax=Actinoplanes sp. NPDC051494 TaxID=3363907 RepID=UPI0037AED739
MTASRLTAVVAAHHEISMLAGDRIAPVLAGHRLTPATAQALWAIDPAEAPPSMKTMTERLYCNAPNLTFITNQLIDRGLVERGADPSDRRTRVLILTERGRRVRAEVLHAMLEQTPFAALSDADLKLLEALLAKALGARR